MTFFQFANEPPPFVVADQTDLTAVPVPTAIGRYLAADCPFCAATGVPASMSSDGVCIYFCDGCDLEWRRPWDLTTALPPGVL